MIELSSNVLVPKLLDKINNYANSLRRRIKVDGIFNEFEISANTNFKKFIKLSDERYKSVKSGESIDNILKQQQPEYSELSNNILLNKFYNNTEIENEAQKLLKKFNRKENQELYKLRKEIMSKTREYSKNEIEHREKLLSKAGKKRKKINYHKEKGLKLFILLLKIY